MFLESYVQSKQGSKIVEPELHVGDIIHKVKLEAEHEPIVEFNEEDMNDPNLFNELQANIPVELVDESGSDLNPTRTTTSQPTQK